MPTQRHGEKLVELIFSCGDGAESVELGYELGISLITSPIPQGEVVRNSDPCTDPACDWLLIICSEELRHLRYSYLSFIVRMF